MSPYNPDFDRDLAFGEAMELEVEGILSALRNGGLTYEVKSDRFANGCWFLEWEQRPQRSPVWQPSGIQTTRSHLWVIRFPEPVDALEVWRTDTLRQVAAAKVLGPLIDAGTRGSNPTRGWKVSGPQIANHIRLMQKRAAS